MGIVRNQNRIICLFKKRLDELTKYRTDNKEIRFIQGKVSGNPEKINYNYSNWNKAELPLKPDVKKELWIRKEITVPEKINGISLAGSGLEICGSGLFPAILAHGELFINEKKVIDAQSWIELRYRYKVAEKVVPGQKHIIALHIIAKKHFTDMITWVPLIEERYSNVEEFAFEIESFIGELKFAQYLSRDSDLIEAATRDINTDHISILNLEDLLGLIIKIRGGLFHLKPLAKNYKVNLIGHSHIDMGVFWPMDENVEICRDTFGTVNKLMNDFPEFCFSQSQAYLYNLVEKKYPKLFENIKKRVCGGRWEITATSWVELDLNMVNGESIIRQILYAKKYIKEKFNFEPRIFWAPDNFGHPWTLPQILKKSEIDYYYFMRVGKKDADLFWWQGPDGSKVLAFNSVYFGNIDVDNIVELAKLTEKNQKTKISMYVYGVCDHGGAPTKFDIEAVHKLNQKKVLPELEFSTTDKYFNSIADQNVNIPVIDDELNPIFDGCYTSYAKAKSNNRKCERLLIEAEKLGAISMILGGKYPDLKDFWEITMCNQFHDLLGGASIKSTDEFANKGAEKVEINVKDIINDCVSYLNNKIKINDKGLLILVFNSLSWARTDVVKIKKSGKIPLFPVIKDEDGNKFPVQLIDDDMVFIAKDIPPLGYKVFYICEGEEDNSLLIEKPFEFENEFFCIRIDNKTGTISYLYDKKNNKIVMNKYKKEGFLFENAFPAKIKPLGDSFPCTGIFMNNMLQVLFEEPHDYHVMAIGPISGIMNLIKDSEIEVIEKGPVVGKVRIKNNFNRSSIIQEISIYSGIDRIDFDTFIDWQEKSGPGISLPMLKASFTPILGNTKATFEIPYGSIERVADGTEFPALQWIDISDNEYGLSLLSNTKYGFDVKGNTMRITLIRTNFDPFPDADMGEHRFAYSLYPHKGNFNEGDTVRKGYEFNYPLISSYINQSNNINLGCDVLPQIKSFISVDTPNVVLSSLKKAEDNEDLVIRIYETRGKQTRAFINFGFDIINATEVNLLEKSIENSNILLTDRQLKFSISPFEIKTFRIKLWN